MMRIWRYLPYMVVILLCLCGMAVAGEFTLTTGGTVPLSGAENITLSAPDAGTTGLSVMAAATEPDMYSMKTALSLDAKAYSVTTESSGGYEKAITSGKLNHVHPRVSENYIVYEQWNAGSSAVGIYDLASGNQGLMYAVSQQQTYPDASGRLVVYEQNGAYSNTITNVWGYDTQSQGAMQVSPSTTNQDQPAISGRYMVWQDWSTGNADIALADLNSGKAMLICDQLGDQKKPAVSGEYVVWEDWRNGNADIYLFDIATGTEYQLTTNKFDQRNPRISGNIVVYEDNRNGNSDIYALNLQNLKETRLTSGAGKAINPDVSGALVVWEDYTAGNADIMLLDLITGRIYVICNDIYDQKNPSIFGSRIVWEDYRTGNPNIYLFSLGSSGPVGSKYSFYGTAAACGSSAPAGSVITAVISGTSAPRATYTMTQNGIYGSQYGPYLEVPVYAQDAGKSITFYINDNPADQTVPIGSGGTRVLDLTASCASPVNSYQFSGQVMLDSQYAPAGTIISALVDGKSRAQVSAYQAGRYSGLIVPVYASDSGKYVTFTATASGITYSTSQQVWIGSAGSGTGGGSGGIVLMSAESASGVSAESSVSQNLDLVFTSSPSPATKYLLNGEVRIDNQYAPTGTLITASINNQVRAQVNVNPAGQYSGLTIPVYASDNGKPVTFTATLNGVIYTSSQQVWIGTAGTGSGTGSGGVTLLSAESAGVSAESTISQRVDLAFTASVTPTTRYLLNGEVRIGNQYAPTGTLITASINNQVRAQVNVNPAGQYSGLSIPVYGTDYGKPVTFTATSNGVIYTSSQQVWVGTAGTGTGSGTGSGGVTLLSADSAGVSAEGTVSQRVDLVFTASVPQGKYQFYGPATIDGTPLQSGRLIYAVVDGQVRGQITVTSPGSYGTQYGPYLEVPITSGDIGKTIRFQTDSGAVSDQTQLIVSGMLVSKSLVFSSKPSEYADFIATPLQGVAPLSVKFTDKSSGSPKSHSWDFGDGTTSTDKNPVHIYNRDGVYSVGLVTGYWNGQSKTVVKQNLISVGAVSPPSAQIGLNPGWNFISTPKTLTSGMDTAKALFGRIDVGGHSIFSYNPNTKSWVTVGPNTVIKPLDAVWIFSTKKDAVYLYFTGDAIQIPPTKKLVKGWNTFGVTSLNPVSAYNSLLSVKDRWVYVIGYDSATQRFQNTIMNVPESSQGQLYPGFGYWIYMSAEGDLAAVGL